MNVISAFLAFKASRLSQPRWPKGSPKGGQWKDGSIGDRAIGDRGRSESIPISSRISGTGGISRHTIQVINRVHKDGNLPKTKVIESTAFGISTGSQGVFHPYSNKILVDPRGPYPHLTAAHEIGHALDMKGFRGKGMFRSESELKFANWRAAVDKSPTYRKWAAWQRGGGIVLNNTKYIVNPKVFTYMLSHREVWARSYAQYIAVKSKDPKLLADLRRRQAYPPGGQWSDKEFKPIMRSIDALLKNEGWK